MKLKLKPKVPSKKVMVIMLIVLMVVIVALFAYKFFVKGDDGVPFEVLGEELIPKKIQQILPRYKNLERALACKVDEQIFVITTRGEKPTGGYTIAIDRIEKEQQDEKAKLVVYTTFKDPKPGDVVTQVVTYPYIVVKTDLKELPDKIELRVKYDD